MRYRERPMRDSNVVRALGRRKRRSEKPVTESPRALIADFFQSQGMRH